MPIAKADQRYTYNDYITWDDNERWEIIDGVAYSMAPAPNLAHQIVTGNLFAGLKQGLQGSECEVFIAPTDVVFSATDIVQPDIAVVCDPEKLKNGKNIQGAPDLIIEVLSPYTEVKDRREKKALYEKYGVKEYGLVHPVHHFVELYRLMNNSAYHAAVIYNRDQCVPVSICSEISLSLTEVFGEEKTVTEPNARQEI